MDAIDPTIVEAVTRNVRRRAARSRRDATWGDLRVLCNLYSGGALSAPQLDQLAADVERALAST